MKLRFQQHPCFVEPDEDAILWRYMSFAKFARILTDQSLWLPSLADLAKNDPYEGALPNGNFRHRSWCPSGDLNNKDREKIEATSYARNDTLEAKMRCEAMIRDHRILQTYAARHEQFVSCWFESSHESAGMWNIYAPSSEGVAIATTCRKLKRSLTSKDFSPVGGLEDNGQPLMMGRVKYIDYETDEVDITNGFNAVLSKRMSFKHENEVRLVRWNFPNHYQKGTLIWDPSEGDFHLGKTYEEVRSIVGLPGIPIQCDVNDLIESVWVAPIAPAWFAETVEAFCRSNGVSARLRKSAMMQDPLH